MPEYLAPGVYVEETSFRAKSIEGVGTSTAGFVGPTRYGPIEGEPELITSFNQFERIYGGLDPLEFDDGAENSNYLAHAVRAFFDNGGARLYIARTYKPLGPSGSSPTHAIAPIPSALINTVENAAVIATRNTQSALKMAETNIRQAHDDARVVLDHAVNKVLSVISTTSRPNLNYQDTVTNIETQINNWIQGPPENITPEETSALTTAWTTWRPVINTLETLWRDVVGVLNINTANSQQIRDNALEGLQYAVNKVLSVLSTTPRLNLNYQDTVTNIETQINNWIQGPPENITPEETSALTAAWTTWRPVINRAEVIRTININTASLQQIGDNALEGLQYAVDKVLGALSTTPRPNLNYEDTVTNIETQINSWIQELTGNITAEETSALTAAWNTWRPVVNWAEARTKETAQMLERINLVRNDVSIAYEEGVKNGKSPQLSESIPQDYSELQNSGEGVLKAGKNIREAADNLPSDVKTVIGELEEVDAASTAVTEVEELITKTSEVIQLTETAIRSITDSVKNATLQRRLARDRAADYWKARFPGDAGNVSIRVTGRLGANVLGVDLLDNNSPRVMQLRSKDLVVILRHDNYALIFSAIKEVTDKGKDNWIFTHKNSKDRNKDRLVELKDLDLEKDKVFPLSLTVEIERNGKFGQGLLWNELTVNQSVQRNQNSVTKVFASKISNRLQELETPVILHIGANKIENDQLATDLLSLEDWRARDASGQPTNNLINVQANSFKLAGGNDGHLPDAESYKGKNDEDTGVKSGLACFEDLEDISIIAAPGYSQNWQNRESDILAISQHLITHCERMRYRVAVLDSPNEQAPSGIQDYRGLVDTTHAALYYPWIKVLDPVSNQEISLPPSGFIAGIYARNDVEIGVHKAPANEVVRGAIGLESTINKAQQDLLNPLGINCIRFFEGRGIRVWGARTISSDPEWKYLNIRRYFAYLERSIERSTQWAVFQPNGERLWDNIRRSVESFLETEWREGRLAGAKLEQAFWVRCDRSTMTQNDIDNGRLICLIGVAPLYPAEFVIFRIGQWTANRR